MVKKLKSPRRLAALAVFAIVAMSAFGFAAANTVNPSNAGDGVGDVSGGTVSNIHYVLVAGSTEISAVHFNYSATAANARVALMDGSTLAATELAGTNCGASLLGYDFGCVFAGGSGVDVVDVEGLRATTWD